MFLFMHAHVRACVCLCVCMCHMEFLIMVCSDTRLEEPVLVVTAPDNVTD